MINILLSGCLGQMGGAVTRAAASDGECKIAYGFDREARDGLGYPVYSNLDTAPIEVDAIIDFSHPSSLTPLLSFAKNNHIPAVICTTGLSSEQTELLHVCSKEIPLFVSANMSVGVSLITDLAMRAAKLLGANFDIEIIEKHHNKKIDAPSGTALMLADAISGVLPYNANYTYDRHSVRKKRDKNEIGMHAIRGGTIVGEHSVIFAGNNEVVEITHSAESKEVFAAGAIIAAKFLQGKPPALYNMKDLVASVDD